MYGKSLPECQAHSRWSIKLLVAAAITVDVGVIVVSPKGKLGWKQQSSSHYVCWMESSPENCSWTSLSFIFKNHFDEHWFPSHWWDSEIESERRQEGGERKRHWLTGYLRKKTMSSRAITSLLRNRHSLKSSYGQSIKSESGQQGE